MPLVTIGMPVWNCQNTIRAAITSILNQTYRNWELLIIDDGSTDDTVEIASDVADDRIYLFTDGNRLGLPFRINQALSLCRGDYFARMDADDICYPGRLALQVDYLERNPGVDLVGSSMIVFESDGSVSGKLAPPISHASIVSDPFVRIPVAHPTFCGKREWFAGHRYNETFHKAQDQELLVRTYQYSQFANIPDILLGYRRDRLSLKGSLRSRYFLLRAQIGEMRRQKKPYLAWGPILRQSALFLLDMMAIASGGHYHVLPQWSGKVAMHERYEWSSVWRSVNQDGAAPRSGMHDALPP